MTTLYANPYNTSFTRFYFDSTDQFELKMSQVKWEDVKIDYIDGDNPRLFQAASIHQCDIGKWFDEFNQYSNDGYEASSIFYLVDMMHLDEVIKRRDDVVLHRGSLADYAYELVEDLYSLDQLPDLIRNHIDYDSIGRDLELNNEVTELSRMSGLLTATSFNQSIVMMHTQF